jgi:hypothetical protein
MLTLFSPGLALTSFVFDIIYPIMDNDRVLGGRLLDCRRCDRGLAAAAFGLIDYWPDIPSARHERGSSLKMTRNSTRRRRLWLSS